MNKVIKIKRISKGQQELLAAKGYIIIIQGGN